MGKCNKVWLKEFYHSASGASAQDWIGKQKKADRLSWPDKRGIKILFPTLRTVRQSRLGEAVSLSLSSSDLLQPYRHVLPGRRNDVFQENGLGISWVPKRTLSRFEEQTWGCVDAHEGVPTTTRFVPLHVR